MTSLRQKYYGAQDRVFSPEHLNPLTFESDYLDTINTVLVWKDGSSNRQKVEFNNMNRTSKIGFTGVRFDGDPSTIESIEVDIGGQRFDKIYPSITGQFDPIPLFDAVIPNTIYHVISLRIVFLRENIPLTVNYDRVTLRLTPNYDDLPLHEAMFASTQFVGGETVVKGTGRISLPYNHPVETIKVFSDAALTNVVLNIDRIHNFHVPSKGKQNGMYLYQVSFNGLINFSRIDNAILEFEASEDTCIYPFAKTHNVGRFLAGMAGLAFSK